MKTKKITQTLTVLVLITSGVASGQTQVPNTFQSGQPARAAEVNQNFSTLETAVNDNATAIADGEAAILANTQALGAVAAVTIPRVKANGQDIGAFLNATHDNDPKNLFRRQFWALSDTGYLFSVSASDTSIGPAGVLLRRLIWFSTPNCSGVAYVPATRDLDFPLTAHYRSGAVFASEQLNDNPGVYYTPKDSEPISITLQSQISSGCNAQTESVEAFEVFPNDPQITGVPTQRNFNPPITLDVQTFLVPVPPPP